VGTSAMRDARGGPEFARRAGSILGGVPRIVSGEEEARLTFAGALSGTSVRGDVAVVDVGGGSTEIVRGTWDGAVASIADARSLDVGSVRLTERHVASDPPSPDELARVSADVDAALASVPALPPGVTLVGVAGTVTTVAAVAHDVAPYDGARVHGSTLTLAELVAVRERLSSVSAAERRRIPALDPKRADVIVAGALVVEQVARWAGATSMIVSDRGVRWGVLLDALNARHPG
jgi:exopolyphosphatase / guanosine-5'-triphosphate,3'-diphosphate pyrophosphatase